MFEGIELQSLNVDEGLVTLRAEASNGQFGGWLEIQAPHLQLGKAAYQVGSLADETGQTVGLGLDRDRGHPLPVTLLFRADEAPTVFVDIWLRTNPPDLGNYLVQLKRAPEEALSMRFEATLNAVLSFGDQLRSLGEAAGATAHLPRAI